MAEQDAYQAAMKQAASAAWDQNWDSAIMAYNAALKAVPNDAQALAGLALAQLEIGEYREALQTYANVSKLVPSDPLPHEKMAEIFEGTGDYEHAAKEYLTAGEIYFARKDLQRALPNWEHAVRLDIDLAQAHMRLAVIFERSASTRQRSVFEYLHVARLLQKANQAQRAAQALQRAQRLDSINAEVRNALGDLRKGTPIQVTETYDQFAPVEAQKVEEETLSEEQAELLKAADEDERQRTPVEEAARVAMGVLADIIWTGEVPQEAQAPLLQALDAHQVSDVETAIDLYQQARAAGLDHPALRFNLGVLYQYQRQFAETIDALLGVVNTPEYAVAAHLMLGQAYFAQDDLRTGAGHILSALRSADEQINPAQVDEGGYDRLAASFAEQSDEYLLEFSKAITFYLDDPQWQEKLAKALVNYQEKGKVSYVQDLVELMIEGGRPELAEIMQRVDDYVERNLLHLASEEIHYAIERAPDYLPAHHRLADILVREARTQEAATKINLIANTYMMRGNNDKAADLFAQVIDLWPADTDARRRVIDMMRSQGRVAEAMRYYAELAELYFRLMADPDRAITVYNEALEYARTAQADPETTVPIIKALADIESQRLNWRKALNFYERVIEIAPDDEDAALAIADLYFQLGDTSEAIKALDNYMRRLIGQGNVGLVTTTLEEQVRRRPEIIPLRQRLAEVYRQQGRAQDAITQLDALGELLLDAGQLDEAINTIKRIIGMNPPDVEGYRSLLSQLESGGQG